MKLTNNIMVMISIAVLLISFLIINFNRDDMTSTVISNFCTDTKNTNYKIPQKIHQYIPNKKITTDMKKLTETWKIINPDFDVIIHDDNDINIFFNSSKNKPIYDKLTAEHKINYFKFCYIYEKGGIWANHNLKCVEPIPITHDTDMMITLDENYYSKFHISDKFFGFTPKSKLLKGVIDIINKHKTIDSNYFSDYYNYFFKLNDIRKFNIVINENYPDYSFKALSLFFKRGKQQKILNNNSTIVKNPEFDYNKHLIKINSDQI